MTTIQVKFYYSESGFCYDVYKIVNSKRMLCRQDEGKGLITWTTFTGEPDCPVRDDILIEVIENKEVIAVEHNVKGNGYFYAEKKFPFSWEIEREKAALRNN
ncbi:MAG: hypothetical protein A2X18_07680 [Bacteroidetes bacterium GWF2_40_14]|nr:MAG: hypothetical protein A2X18_07680 [Bacteroidetes bacterium GWF2_40_14]